MSAAALLASPTPSPSPSPTVTPSPSPSVTEPPSVPETVSWWAHWLTSDAPIRVATIVLFAAVLNWVMIAAIRRVVSRAARQSDRPQSSLALLKERREQRARAIGQLVRSLVTVVIWATALMMILPLFGMDIAPLLASASVIGVALGFGAQTLVRDFLSGIFLILEDQFGVGDFVDLGEAVGTVEEVTLRVTRLRDATGVVWYVRNGDILRVANRSQGWTLAIVDVPVGYETDIDRVHEIVDATAAAMLADPACPVSEFNTPHFAGVESVSGEAVIVRITAKADPSEQLPLQRLIRQRMKQAFDDAGIRVPVVFRIPTTPPPASKR